MAAAQGPFYTSLGRNIRTARLKERLTQAALAASVGMTRTSITNIETGRQPIHVHTLAEIVRVLNSSYAKLLPRSPNQTDEAVEKLTNLSPEEKKWVSRVIATRPEKTIAAKIPTR
jgi:transcriptional regulator with XRE-family HTH domain